MHLLTAGEPLGTPFFTVHRRRKGVAFESSADPDIQVQVNQLTCIVGHSSTFDRQAHSPFFMQYSMGTFQTVAGRSIKARASKPSDILA